MFTQSIRQGVMIALTLGLVACGGGGDASDDTTNGTITPPPGGFDVTNAIRNSCDTEDGHASYKGRDCTASGCHATQKTMSYAGSAPSGTTVYVKETATGTIWALPTNSQGNFCLRTKYGGNPHSGYMTMTATGAMVAQPTNGSCNTTACHDAGRPIF